MDSTRPQERKREVSKDRENLGQDGGLYMSSIIASCRLCDRPIDIPRSALSEHADEGGHLPWRLFVDALDDEVGASVVSLADDSTCRTEQTPVG